MVGVFTVVDMRDVAASVTPIAAALPIESIATYLEVLARGDRFRRARPTVHQLAVDALVNHWSDDDPRWTLLDRRPGELPPTRRSSTTTPGRPGHSTGASRGPRTRPLTTGIVAGPTRAVAA